MTKHEKTHASEVNGSEQPGVPTAAQIEEAMKGNQRIQSAGVTFAFLSGNAQQMMTGMCGGNPRLALAIVSELKMFYEEVIKRSIEINHGPAQPSPEAASEGEIKEITAA